MLFSLEAFQADEGDSLLLHYGPPDHPKFILIDGGPTPNIYDEVIKPRLQEIRERFVQDDDAPLPLDMVWLSHFDGDHITGIGALLRDLQECEDDSIPPPWRVKTLWFNSFDEILGNRDEEIFSELTRVAAAGLDAPLPGAMIKDRYGEAVVAAVPDGRLLRRAAEKLGIARNAGFNGLIMAGHDEVHQVVRSHGLKLTVIAPDERRVAALHDEWEASLKKQPDIEKLAELAANSDQSVANLSSIVVFAELSGKTMLLTGDARSDDILKGLEGAGLLPDRGVCPVDILKVPHHGSDRNVTQKFFKCVPARHYVISANGLHDNPDVPTLKMIEAGRADSDDFTIHLTNHTGENNIQAVLDEFFDGREERGRSYKVKYRDDIGDDAPSICVDLLEKVAY